MFCYCMCNIIYFLNNVLYNVQYNTCYYLLAIDCLSILGMSGCYRYFNEQIILIYYSSFHLFQNVTAININSSASQYKRVRVLYYGD